MTSRVKPDPAQRGLSDQTARSRNSVSTMCFGRAGKAVAERPESGQREAMLRLEHRGEQRVLALEMIVERALGDRGGRRDLVHAHAGIALAAKQGVGRIEDALPGPF